MSTSKMLIAILGLVFLAAPVCSGDKDVKNLEQLKQDLKSPDPAVRVQAIRDILQFKYQGVEEVIPLLVQRLRDPNDKIRTGASIALRRMQIPRNRVAEVVRALGNRVAKDSKVIVRYEAIKSLQHLGTDARPVIGDLIQGVEDKQTYEIRSVAIDALVAAGVDEKKGPDPRVTDVLIRRTMPSEPSQNSFSLSSPPVKS